MSNKYPLYTVILILYRTLIVTMTIWQNDKTHSDNTGELDFCLWRNNDYKFFLIDNYCMLELKINIININYFYIYYNVTRLSTIVFFYIYSIHPYYVSVSLQFDNKWIVFF